MAIRAVLLFLLLLPTTVWSKADAPAAKANLTPTEQQSYISGWVRQFFSNSRFHYSPRPLDDSLSESIYKAYLDSLDGDRLFFLADDIERFDAYRKSLDDALAAGRLDPAFEIYNTYVTRVGERTAYARALLKEEFDFASKQEYAFKRDKLPWEKSRKSLDNIWRQRVMNDVLRLKLAGKDDKGIRETLDKRYASYEQRVREIGADDVFQTFINAYASSIEPHTAYMNARATENFNISMRLSLEGIGAVLQREEDLTVIRSIVPGGPAAMSGKLKVGDRIVAVGQGQDGPMVDVVGWRIDDVVEKIRGPKDTQVRLEIIPADAGPDGAHERVTLTRQKVKLEEQAAKKRVVELADGRDGFRRVGVIELPTFYQDFEGRRRDEPDYRSASRDVARLIDELKAENVEGLVIDLRDNGGGSLTEAIELTGLFIDRGPVVQVRDQSRRVQIESDNNSGVAWDGPLAVLVNRASASASEIFAAAIQDYGRGLIIGEPTFGKGTVQNLVDLDRFASRDKQGLGQLRLTVAQFFRINGGSTQNRGVIPDLNFPVTLLDAKEFGESAYSNALPYTEIEPAPHERLAEFAPLLPILAKRHEDRAGKDIEFRWWVEDVSEFRRQQERRLISLNFEERRRERDETEQRRKQRQDQRVALGQGSAAAEPQIDDGLQADERPVANRDDASAAAENKQPDALIREAAHVLVDAIDLLRHDRGLAAQVYPKRAAAAAGSN